MKSLTIADLSRWGFVDQNSDGKISINELPSYKNSDLQNNQRTAFLNLANLSGDKNTIEQSDLDVILLNSNKLSEVMLNDPEYRSDLINGAVVEQGKREVFSGYNGDGIPPIAFQRILSFAQLALRFQGARLSVSGVYSQDMTRAVANFQNKVGLSAGRNGSFIDRSTFAALALHSKYNPATLKATLTSIRTWLLTQTPKAFLLDNHRAQHPDHVDLIIATLQYLYPAEVPAWKTQNRLDDANNCLTKHFGGTWVGPKVLQGIIDELDKRIPKQ